MRRIVMVGAILIGGLGAGRLHAQAVLTDPKDAPKIFSTNCSMCHKSPQGLAKSDQVAGFLRQHYTTGPEMSAAMAAYLVAAGSGPASKKGAATTAGAAEGAAARTKGKKQEKQEQLSAAHPSAETGSAAGAQKHTLRGKMRPAVAHEAEPAVRAAPTEQAARPAETPAADEHKQAASLVAPATPQPAEAPPPAAPQIDLD